MRKESEQVLWAQVMALGNQITVDMSKAIALANDLPGGMAEDAVNLLCKRLAEARALACSWMNDIGEP